MMNDARGETGVVWVRLGTRSYPVTVRPGCLAMVAGAVRDEIGASSAAVVSGRGIVARYAAAVADAIVATGLAVHRITIASGERAKTLRTVETICREMADARMDRRAVVVAVGGGVVGDIAGFAAAIYMRGIEVIHAPTTLLAQVDASVGGKTGVDLPSGKNLIGAFHQPRAVFADPAALSTLPAREMRCGLAEIIKHGLIRDHAYLDMVLREMPRLVRRDPEALTRAVLGSCRIKADVVMADETEQGVRAVLNFGHTVGHALESLGGYRSLRHGEAVAIGMAAACRIGEELGVTSPNVTETVIAALRDARLPHAIPGAYAVDTIVDAMATDKKSDRGKQRFVLLREVGHAEAGFEVPAAALRQALRRTMAS